MQAAKSIPKSMNSQIIPSFLYSFQDEHGVVEELLPFLIGEVDAQLFHAVVLRWDK